MKGRVPLLLGGVMMILLGIARGAGGAILLVQGPAADPAIQASRSAVVVLGGLLTALGVGLVGSAVGVLRRRRRAWHWGTWLVVAFVIDGLVNGYVFFGSPGDRGTIVNLVAAALILTCLFVGRSALVGGPGAESEAR